MSSSWSELLIKNINQVKNVFITRSEFENIIKSCLGHPQCPINGLRYSFSLPDPFDNFVVGVEGTGTIDSRPMRLYDHRDTQCQVDLWWIAAPVLGSNETVDYLIDLVRQFWKPELRTVRANFPDLKLKDEVASLANNTIRSMSRIALPSSVLFCDLDNFKPINDRSHDEGNRVINEFGAILQNVLSENAVYLHYGGDEFIVLLPGGDLVSALNHAYLLHKKILDYNFGVEEGVLSVSFGIAGTEFSKDHGDFSILLHDADRALADYAKAVKGVARFPENYTIQSSLAKLPVRLDLAHCIIKSCLGGTTPFANVWLNYLSTIVADTLADNKITLSNISSIVNSFVKWAKFDIIDSNRCKACDAREKGIDAQIEVSSLDLAFAISHGLLRKIFTRSDESQDLSLSFKYDASNNVVLNEKSMGRIWTYGQITKSANKYEIGKSWTYGNNNSIPANTSQALLIKIGHDELKDLPASIFADIIVVDDRPTRGGGLPDFWEATIARLVTQIIRNPHINATYLVGRHEYGKRTIEKLKDVENWKDDAEHIAEKTGMSFTAIQQSSESIKGKIEFPNSIDRLLNHLAELLRKKHMVRPLIDEPLSKDNKRYLRRDLVLEDMALGKEDGCRVKTIEEAYPVVIEIARKATSEAIIRDQAGLELRELIDFKVHLTNPTQNKIPTFYKQEKESLETYFNKEFLEDDGLFGERLNSEDQKKIVLGHVVKVLESGKNYATRRAVLIIPHGKMDPGDISPLGLISIRIIPRFGRDQVYLNYSYTWRTVESMVGFPYSLFGSVRYSEHLTEEIKKQLQKETARKVRTGWISYLAHSLHFFMDDYGQNIARRIIDGASY